jgi:hypothetical protein
MGTCEMAIERSSIAQIHGHHDDFEHMRALRSGSYARFTALMESAMKRPRDLSFRETFHIHAGSCCTCSRPMVVINYHQFCVEHTFVEDIERLQVLYEDRNLLHVHIRRVNLAPTRRTRSSPRRPTRIGPTAEHREPHLPHQHHQHQTEPK